MVYILTPFVAWIISQSLKFIIFSFSPSRKSFQSARWIYIWAGGAPSSHTALLVSALYVLGANRGFDAIFMFCLVVCLLMIYNMTNERKKQQELERYCSQSNEPGLQNIAREGILMDLSGHTVSEIVWGALLGCTIGAIVTTYFT